MIELFFAELRRNWIQFTRYPTEAIGAVFITTLVFYGLFLSARYIAGPSLQLGDRLDAIIVGYVLWTLVLFSIGSISNTLQLEAQTGTLEQLLLSPYSAVQIFVTRAVASLTSQLSLNFTILLVIMTLTGRYLALAPIMLLPLGTVLLAAMGLGFALGSLALLFKRIQQLLNISQFALLFLLTLPMETWTGPGHWLGYLLPMMPGAGLLREMMARHQPLDWGHLAIALLNSALYFGAGVLLFRYAERTTRRRGQVGGY